MSNPIIDFFSPKYSEGARVQAVMEKVAPSQRGYATADQLISSMYTASGDQGYASEFTWRELVASYTSWVFTSVDKIAKTIANAPKRLYFYKSRATGKIIPCPEIKATLRSLQGDDRKAYLKELHRNLERVEVVEHPLLTLVTSKPNPIDTQAMFWTDIVVRLELAGSCGIYKGRNFLRTPTELWVLPTSENGEFKPVPDKKLVIKGYHYSDGEVQEDYTLDEAFWMRYPNPKNKFEGMSPLKAQIFPYNIDYYLAKQQYKFFKNNAVVGKTLTTDQKMSQDELDKLYDKIEEKFAGAAQAYKTLILHSGLKADDPRNTTAKDMMLDVIGKYAKDRMLSAYGINEGMVGLTENQNKANLDTSRENYIAECVRPRANFIIECFERWLLPDFDERLEFDIDLPEVQQREIDIEERKANLETMTTTINEERQKMKLDPVPWGDAPWYPFTLSQFSAEPPREGPPAPRGSAKPAEEEEGAVEGKSMQTKAKKDLLWKRFDLSVRKSQELFRKTAVKLFEEQKAEALSFLEKKGALVKGNIAGWGRQKVQSWLKEHKDRYSFDRDKWEERTKELFKPVFVSTLKSAGDQRMNDMSRRKAEGFEFDLGNERVVEWIGTKLRVFSEEITGTTFDEVEDVLRTGFEESQPLSTIAETLREKFDASEEYRAANIARTEAANTWNAGDLEAMKQLGLEGKVDKFWINEPGARDTHAKAGEDYAEDKAIGLDEEFEVGEDAMLVPGGGLLAEENCNCFVPDTLFYSPNTKMIYRSIYNGKVITVETASGHKLTGTPNHPVLTSRGFIGLQFLKKGDCVISSDLSDGVGFGNLDIQDRPTVFEEKFRSLSKKRSPIRVVGTNVNFYGDRPESDVDIVCVNSELLNRMKSFLIEKSGHFFFPKTNNRKIPLFGKCLLERWFNKKFSGFSSNNFVGGTDELDTLLFTGIAHSDEHGFASISWDDSMSGENAINGRSCKIESFGKRLDGSAGIKAINNLIGGQQAYNSIPSADTMISCLPEPTCNSAPIDAALLRYLRMCFSAPVFFDKIVNIQKSSYRGDVFTAETYNGIYISNGVIVKNCRCTLGYTEAKE